MEHKENILKLYAKGKSYREIQKILGCSKGTIAYHLGAGQKEKTLARQRDKRGEIKKLIQEIKQKNPCVDCKENYPYWMMDFDHLGNKTFDISKSHYYTQDIDVIKLEIKKCEIVCANCHRNRTHMRSFSNGSNSPDISNFYN
jgi:transposase